MNKYEDIIYMDRPISKHHKMSIQNRAAEFSAFQALDGYENSINNVNKIKEIKKELSDEEKDNIDRIINILEKDNNILITYYNNEKYCYETIINTINKIDYYNKLIILKNKVKINILDIIKIDIL